MNKLQFLLIGMLICLGHVGYFVSKPNGYISADMEKAIVLQNSVEIKRLLNAGVIPDDVMICFAMNSKLRPDLLLLFASSSSFNLNHTYSNNLTLLKYLLKFPFNDYVHVLIYLLDHGVDIALPEDYLKTNGNLGGHAYGESQILLIKAFLRNGYKPDFILHSRVWNYICMAWYSKECWELLLSSGLSPSAEIHAGERSMPLLMWAIIRRYTNLVELLVSRKVNLNQLNFINDEGSLTLPLVYTLSLRKHETHDKSLEEVISILIQSGAHL